MTDTLRERLLALIDSGDAPYIGALNMDSLVHRTYAKIVDIVKEYEAPPEEVVHHWLSDPRCSVVVRDEWEGGGRHLTMCGEYMPCEKHSIPLRKDVK